MIGHEKQYILSKFLGQLKLLNTHTFIKCCMRHLYISLMHLICPPPPQILHNLCFSFLMGITAVPKERCIMEDVQVAYV